MAEQFEVIISADSKQLTSELQKAQNTLRQFEAALKKSTNIGEIEYLSRNISLLKTKIDSLNVSQGKLSVGSNKAAYALNDLSRIAQDAPYGFIGISNNINPLLESFQRLQAESKATGNSIGTLLVGALKGPAGLGLAIGVVSAAVTFMTTGLSRWGASAEKTKEKIDELKKSQDALVSSLSKEYNEVSILVEFLKKENLTREEKAGAIKKLQQLAPEYFSQLDKEKSSIENITAAYKLYNAEVLKKVEQQAIEATLLEVTKKIIELRIKGQNLTNQQLQENGKILKTQQGIYQQTDQELSVREQIKRLYEGTIGLGFEELKLLSELEKTRENLVKQASKYVKITGDLDGIKKIKKETEKFEKIKLKPLELKPIVISDKKIQAKIREDLANKIIPPKGIPIPITFLPEKTGLIDIADQINNFLANAANTIGTTFADILSQAITKGISFGDAFKEVFGALGGVIAALGQELIKVGTLAIAAKIALNSVLANPLAVIAVGIALAALGQAIQATTNKQRFAVGTRYAPGGMALVGERGPELVNLPRGSQVIPAAQTSNMMGAMNQVEVFGVLRGQDIYFSNKKYGQTYGRTT